MDKPLGEIYYTHDNGGRPFEVILHNDKVTVYKIDPVDAYDTLVGSWTSKRTFVGTSRECAMTRFSGGLGKEFDGNTILVHLKGLEYLVIGMEIYKFTAPEEIENFYASVGNSDVPYPVARTRNYAIFILDNNYAPISEFSTIREDDGDTEAWLDLYTEKYRQKQEYPSVNTNVVYGTVRPEKLKGFEIIQERIW